MIGRKHVIAVAKMVFAELAGYVPLCLEQASNGRVLFLHTLFGTGKADLGKTSSENALDHDVGRPSSRARLFAVIVSEEHALFGDAVDVRCPITHHAFRVGADIAATDVVTPYHKDIWLLGLGFGLRLDLSQSRRSRAIGRFFKRR